MKELDIIYEGLNEVNRRVYLIKKELEAVEELLSEKERYKLWKAREGKCFLVELFHTPIEQDCEYCFVEKVNKDSMITFYGRKDGKYKARIVHDWIIHDYCSKWTEITKLDFDIITKDYQDLTAKEDMVKE